MSLVIAAAQSASLPGEIARNVAHHLRIANIAARHGAQLLVFPELSLTGYELALAASRVVDPASPLLHPLRNLATQERLTIVVGAPVQNSQHELHIAALALHPNGSLSIFSKQHVHQSEEHVFTAGPGGALLPIADVTVALAICADAAHPPHAARAAAQGARVYAASAMITADAYHRKTALLQGYARQHRMAVLLANYSGATGGDESAGQSALWSEDGRLVVTSAGTDEALVIGTKQGGIWTGVVYPIS